MAISLMDLPYEKTALAPHISEDTLNYHHGKHHQAYVTKTNDAIKGTALDDADLEAIVKEAKKTANQGLFNNSAQVWNHNIYWQSMSPNGGGAPKAGSKIAEAIDKSFGSYDEFKAKFKDAGGTQFGSGWAWLVAKKDGSLEILKTLNADCPLTDESVTTLLTMDVWEHAYYLDYQNARPDYMTHFLDNLVNWDFAEERLAAA
ncbi:manganese superoxide dismutase Mn-SOD [Parvularcula bermudensis HTCC2503]|uniref:Superoxide dismutase n=1 Tax=Parvularcula bermudensis (strain ATCC BAA-594 / HTCC2503 / KCTC 12087) TaxID=314260 RepID=E0TI36_PARBH|nr:superoxide dismutase [Parvularcula bermudensis]ADM09375.1 manganese superoxide dismutase Mn-SOD [Parvularcula bermudensis HTCC2503]